MMRKKSPTLFWSLFSLQLIIALSACLFFYRKYYSAAGPVTAIAARAESIFSLPQDILQSILRLSPEEKQKLNHVDLYKARERLMSCPAMKDARVRTLSPGTLIVDYALRQPLFIIGSVGIDKEGVLFPLAPYYPSLSLPKISFPQSEDVRSFLQKEGGIFAMTVKVIEALKQLGLHVEEVDLSDACALGVFRREIRIRAAEMLIIRLPVTQIEQAIMNMVRVRKKYPTYQGILDLRFHKMIYLDQFFSQENTREQKNSKPGFNMETDAKKPIEKKATQ